MTFAYYQNASIVHTFINIDFHFHSFFAGGTKKGTDHIIQSVKLVKINGAILSINMDHSSTHLAVGSDQGHVR